nr:transposase [Peptostreptococcus sp. D1]
METADDIQEAIKELLGEINTMMEAEMDNHLGYKNYECSSNSNYRNDTKSKRVRSSYGEFLE